MCYSIIAVILLIYLCVKLINFVLISEKVKLEETELSGNLL